MNQSATPQSNDANAITTFDAVIFGGGIAGLWTLAELVEQGVHAVLLESTSLGNPQTVSSQGILHSGIKYTLGGRLTGSASNIGDIPGLWLKCLNGQAKPDLSQAGIRHPSCYLWRTKALSSIAGMVGARQGLVTKPTKADPKTLPKCLQNCPGDIFEIKETVIDPVQVCQAFDDSPQLQGRIGFYDPTSLQTTTTAANNNTTPTSPLTQLTVTTCDGQTVKLQTPTIILTAGKGNAQLRDTLFTQLGQSEPKPLMQLRPLHMAMVRGKNLEWLNGHCVDGMATRLTITSDHDSQGQTVWQLGGQLAEAGVDQDEMTLIAKAKQEVAAVLPGFDPNDPDLTWATYRIDRAEGITQDGKRPDDVVIYEEQLTTTTTAALAPAPGNSTPSQTDPQTAPTLLTCWPTKLVLAPKLAALIAERLKDSPRLGKSATAATSVTSPAPFPKANRSTHTQTSNPNVNPAPWETATWH